MIGKPQPGALINRAHPMARGLRHRWVTNEGAGRKLNDSAGKQPMTTNATWTAGRFGKVLDYNGSSQSSSAVTKFAGLQKLTVAWDYYRATNPSTYALIMELSADLGSNFQGSFNVWDGYDGANNTTGNRQSVSVAAVISASNKVTAASYAQPTAGVMHRMMAVMDRELSTDQIVAVYCDGVPLALTYGSPISAKINAGTTTFSDYTMYFGARGGSSFYNACKMGDQAFWGRCLSANEAKADYADRFAAWTETPRRFYSLSTSYTLDAQTGAFIYTGQDAALTPALLMDAGAGAYSLAGQDAALTPLQRSGGGYSSDKKKRRYIRRIGDRLVVFSSAQEAMNAPDDDAPQAEAIEIAQPAKKLPKDAEIVQEMPIAQIKQVAQHFDVAGAVNTMLAAAQYNALLAYIMELQREQDDEEAILLLMA